MVVPSVVKRSEPTLLQITTFVVIGVDHTTFLCYFAWLFDLKTHPSDSVHTFYVATYLHPWCGGNACLCLCSLCCCVDAVQLCVCVWLYVWLAVWVCLRATCLSYVWWITVYVFTVAVQRGSCACGSQCVTFSAYAWVCVDWGVCTRLPVLFNVKMYGTRPLVGFERSEHYIHQLASAPTSKCRAHCAARVMMVAKWFYDTPPTDHKPAPNTGTSSNTNTGDFCSHFSIAIEFLPIKLWLLNFFQ